MKCWKRIERGEEWESLEKKKNEKKKDWKVPTQQLFFNSLLSPFSKYRHLSSVVACTQPLEWGIAGRVWKEFRPRHEAADVWICLGCWLCGLSMQSERETGGKENEKWFICYVWICEILLAERVRKREEGREWEKEWFICDCANLWDTACRESERKIGRKGGRKMIFLWLCGFVRYCLQRERKWEKGKKSDLFVIVVIEVDLFGMLDMLLGAREEEKKAKWCAFVFIACREEKRKRVRKEIWQINQFIEEKEDNEKR